MMEKKKALSYVGEPMQMAGLSKQLLLNNSKNSTLTRGAVPGLFCSVLTWQAHKIDGVAPGLYSAGSWVINVISTYLIEIFIVNKKKIIQIEIQASNILLVF